MTAPKFTIIAMALTLGACATLDGTIAKAPDVERTVALPINTVRDCLLSESPTGLRVASYQDGYRIWNDGGTGTSVNNVALVEPVDGGVRVRMWNHGGWNPFPRSLDNCTG